MVRMVVYLMCGYFGELLFSGANNLGCYGSKHQHLSNGFSMLTLGDSSYGPRDTKGATGKRGMLSCANQSQEMASNACDLAFNTWQGHPSPPHFWEDFKTKNFASLTRMYFFSNTLFFHFNCFSRELLLDLGVIGRRCNNTLLGRLSTVCFLYKILRRYLERVSKGGRGS